MKPAKVGYLGPGTGTFGYQALQKFFFSGNQDCPEKPSTMAFSNHGDICCAVGSMETINYGIVAIENVVNGIVAETVRAIETVDYQLGIKICGETTVPIELFFMNKSGVIEDVKRLLSHETALGQCGRFVSTLKKAGIRVESRLSTGQAAEEASADPQCAALSSKFALANHGLKLIQEKSVVDHINSVTRFWILGKKHARKREGVRYKTSYLVNLEQSASGVLHKTLGVFANQSVPIPILLVYPIPILGKTWEYTFLIEVNGHADDRNMQDAWDDFRRLGISLQPMHFLGSYPDITSVVK
jgi:chorismate mutase/prephenate dehydratase